MDSIGVVVGGVHSDNRGTYSFGHSALLGSHENFRFGQKFWVWAKILGLGENFGLTGNFRLGQKILVRAKMLGSGKNFGFGRKF